MIGLRVKSEAAGASTAGAADGSAPVTAKLGCRVPGPPSARPNRPHGRSHTPVTDESERGVASVAAESSFDVVSKVDHQEVDNAVNQAAKELSQRFDFRGTGTTVSRQGDSALEIRSGTEERANAALDVLKEKLIKRKLSLKILDVPDEPKPSGKEYRLQIGLKEGISTEDAKKISKYIRDEGPKGVKAQVQGDELRVSSKKKDDLQTVQTLVKEKDFDLALQFVNYR